MNTIPGSRRHDFSPAPSEVLRYFLVWLRGFHRDREKSKAADWAMVLLTLLGVVAAIASAWFFQEQLIDARRSTNAAINNFRIDERAWIELEPIRTTPLSPPDNRFPAAFSCSIYPKNVGKTVATDISVKAAPILRTAEFSPQEMQSFQQTLTAKDYTVNIGPDKTTQSVSDRFPSNPIPQVLAPNTSSDAPLRVSCQATKDYPSGGHAYSFVVGRINYCDAFNIRHWKTFCFYVSNARGDVWNCKEGNDEDRNSEEPTPVTSCGKGN